MEGVIVNFRGSAHVKKGNQMIVSIDGSDKEKSKKLIGKTAVWTSSAGKEIKGKITVLHGSKGAVRVIFEKGMPGQSIGSKVKIEE